MKIILLIISAIALSACANLSTLQTGRTLKEGESRYHIGGGAFLLPITTDGGGKRGRLPYLEGMVRKGLSDRLEIGGKATLLGSIGGDIKLKLIDAEKFALSTGFGMGYFSFGVVNTVKDQASTLSFFDFILPMYASYDLNKTLTPYVSPKYVYRAAKNLFDTESSRENFVLLGLGLGVQIRFTEKEGMFLEGTSMRYMGRKDTANQINAAFYY